VITVRFPNGQAVQYNTANYVYRRRRYSDLLTKEDGEWVAQVPNDCIIEGVPAGRVYDALQQQPLEQLTKEVRALRRKMTGRR